MLDFKISPPERGLQLQKIGSTDQKEWSQIAKTRINSTFVHERFHATMESTKQCSAFLALKCVFDFQLQQKETIQPTPIQKIRRSATFCCYPTAYFWRCSPTWTLQLCSLWASKKCFSNRSACTFKNVSRTCKLLFDVVKHPRLWRCIDARGKPHHPSKFSYCCRRMHRNTTHFLALGVPQTVLSVKFFVKINCYGSLKVLSLECQTICTNSYVRVGCFGLGKFLEVLMRAGGGIYFWGEDENEYLYVPNIYFNAPLWRDEIVNPVTFSVVTLP